MPERRIFMEKSRMLREALFQKLHGLSVCLWELSDDFSGVSLPSTDGSRIFWPSEESMSEELLLHELIHCLFCHPYQTPGDPVSFPYKNDTLHITWDMLCDLASWEIARRWLPELFPKELSEPFSRLIFLIPAQILYRPYELSSYLSHMEEEAALSDRDVHHVKALLAEIFKEMPKDDHECWPVRHPLKMLARAKASGQGAGEGDGEDPGKKKKTWEYLNRTHTGPNKPLSPKVLDPLIRKGKGAASMEDRNQIMRVTLSDQRRYDYKTILQSLARWKEEYKLNSSEFHYASYLYGLEHLNGIPLIEPLEYEETKKIYELAIIIDTSASCSRGLTQVFLEETRNIMEEADLFFRPFRIHILQCDTAVRRDDLITSREDFETYIENLEIFGMGGTDFRPAFDHLEKLEQNGEFSALQGILFFTDGLGHYPVKAPDHRTIFIFLKDHYDDIDLPAWAETLILEKHSPQLP